METHQTHVRLWKHTATQPHELHYLCANDFMWHSAIHRFRMDQLTSIIVDENIWFYAWITCSIINTIFIIVGATSSIPASNYNCVTMMASKLNMNPLSLQQTAQKSDFQEEGVINAGFVLKWILERSSCNCVLTTVGTVGQRFRVFFCNIFDRLVQVPQDI